MAHWLHKASVTFIASVPPDELPEPLGNYIKDPDMSAVVGVPGKYWKLVGTTPVEMDTSEKFAVDQAQEQDQEDGDIRTLTEGMIRRLALVMFDEINVLRVNAGLPPRTLAQLKQAMRGK